MDEEARGYSSNCSCADVSRDRSSWITMELRRWCRDRVTVSFRYSILWQEFNQNRVHMLP